MAIATSIVQTTTAWVALGPVSDTVVVNGFVGNRFALSDATPALTDGMVLPVGVPQNFLNSGTAFSGTTIWAIGIDGVGQVVIAT